MDLTLILTVLGIAATFLAPAIGYIIKQRKDYRSYYSLVWKDSAKLRPKDMLGERPYNDYYFERDFDIQLSRLLERPRNTLVVGAPLSGKTRSVSNTFRKLKKSAVILSTRSVAMPQFHIPFVHHLAGCYAQKHPDDDFAETFAVWLTPYSDWRMAYAGRPALEKLQYVENVAVKHGDKAPIVTGGRVDTPVEEIKMTLSEWYETVYGNRISQDQLIQIMRPGISDMPPGGRREEVVTGCPTR